jgi:hypothetical protein
MKDIFYTILVVWVIWRILNSLNLIKTRTSGPKPEQGRRPGETKVDYIPPKNKGKYDGEGEYVDYEEIKD